MGKSWKAHPESFSEISVFRCVTWTDFRKTHPHFQESVNVTTKNSLNIFYLLSHLFRMSFPEIGLAHAPEGFADKGYGQL